MRRRAVQASILALAATGLAAGEGFTSFLGRKPPELVVGDDGWLNAPPAGSLAKLRGRVVWLEFSYLGCGGCIKMEPVLERWHDTYASRGLVVIDVDNGLIDERGVLLRHAREREWRRPLLWDEQGRTAEAFGVRRYPTAYLIDADGTVVWEGNPARFDVPGQLDSFSLEFVAQHEARIVELLESP